MFSGFPDSVRSALRALAIKRSPKTSLPACVVWSGRTRVNSQSPFCESHFILRVKQNANHNYEREYNKKNTFVKCLKLIRGD